MRYITIGALALSMAMAASAAPTDSLPKAPIVECIDLTGRVVIDQPAALHQRLVPKAEAPAAPAPVASVSDPEAPAEQHEATPQTPAKSHAGYRVLVFDDNNPRTARRDANGLKASMENSFPHWRAYVSFNSPYWRVKVGDFNSRAEAEAALSQIKEAYPHLAKLMRVVRDRINSRY